MDIIIKSFNRPYYLDRCIASILENAKGDFNIIVLDDGTPSEYLEKIQNKYPSISILKSKQYDEKIKAIDRNIKDGKSINGFTIPTDLWYEQVKNASDYVLVTEDDVWMIEPINFDNLIKDMQKNKIPLLKLGWLGNYADDQYCDVSDLGNLDAVVPKKLFTANHFLMDLFMYNKYKFFTILYKLGFADNNTKIKYWAINSILMGLYQKDYWLQIWKDAQGKVDEKQQLRNAAVWYHNNKNAIFARTKQEVLKTTFKSSATGSYHQYGENFDVNRMNFILNEAWYRGLLNPMENYPKDFSDDYIKSFLVKANHPDAQYAEWYKWAEKFRKQYKDLGAQVGD